MHSRLEGLRPRSPPKADWEWAGGGRWRLLGLKAAANPMRDDRSSPKMPSMARLTGFKEHARQRAKNRRANVAMKPTLDE